MKFFLTVILTLSGVMATALERPEAEAALARLRERRAQWSAREESAASAVTRRIGDFYLQELTQLATAPSERFFLERCRLGLPGLERIFTAVENGELARRGRAAGPFSIGYGHFNWVMDDLPLLRDFGCNMVQQEIGPAEIFPVRGQGEKKFVPDQKRLAQLAADLAKLDANGMRVMLVTAVHYAPAWWLEEHPDLRSDNGFLKYEVNAPEAREMVAEFLNVLVNFLAASPHRNVIHSLCLSNEPAYRGCELSKEFNRVAFLDSLQRRYGGIENFNRQTGANFSSYAALAEAGETDAVVGYEFFRFRQESFADWHRFMADEVKRYWPEVKVNAKIFMDLVIDGKAHTTGVNPGLFQEFCDFNGNDMYFLLLPDRDKDYYTGWTPMHFEAQYQLSSNPKALFNSENHLITDADKKIYPDNWVYTADFQQYIAGCSGLITWVWGRYDSELFDAGFIENLQYNISWRPSGVWEQALAALDANAAAAAVLAFREYHPSVALFCGTASLFRDGAKASESMLELYAQSAFTGYPVGVVTEEMIMRGGLQNLQAVWLADAAHTRGDVAEKLRDFTRAGGKIYTMGAPLERDEYDRPLPWQIPTLPLESADVEKVLARHCGKLPFEVKVRGEDSRRGIFYRAVPYREGYVVNLVNYRFKPVTLTLNGNGNWQDMLRDEKVGAELELPPLTPQLLYYESHP